MDSDRILRGMLVVPALALIGCTVASNTPADTLPPLPTTGATALTGTTAPSVTIPLEESIERFHEIRQQEEAVAESAYLREVALELEGVDPNMGDEQLINTGIVWCIKMENGMNATEILGFIGDEFTPDEAIVNIASAVAASRSLCPEQGYRFNP